MPLDDYINRTYTGKLETLSRVLNKRGLGTLIAHIIMAESAWRGKDLTLENYKRMVANQLNRRLETCTERVNKGKLKFLEKLEERRVKLRPQSFHPRYAEADARLLKRAFHELFERRGMSNGIYEEIADRVYSVIEKKAPNKNIYEQYDLLIKETDSI